MTKSRPGTPENCDQPLEGTDSLDFATPTKSDSIDDLTKDFEETLSFRYLPQSTPKMDVKPNLALNTDPSLYTSCKLLDNRIQKFSGDEDRTFEEFLDDYTELVDRLGIPLEHAKSLMPLYLTGGAKLKFHSLSSGDKSKWETLATALAKKFKTQALLSNVREELHKLV